MSELIIESRGAIELWTINGEERRNAIRRAVVKELVDGVARASKHGGPRAVIITGAGDKAFCAGADLKERATMSEIEVRAFLDSLRQALRSLEQSDAVFIAALNGAALGGGTELALACDLRVAAPNAELGLTEVKLGIIPGGGGTQRLSRLIGPGRAKDLILTGRRVDANEAMALGLVNRVAPDGKLLDTAFAIAGAIVENAPIAVASAKHAIDDGLPLKLDEALQLEHAFYERVLGTEDRLEGLRAFKERRPPQFKGK